MIECEPNADLGRMTVGGTVRNGKVLVTREVSGQESFPLRHGEQDVTTGGVLLEDTEAPVGVPVRYRITSTPLDRTIQRNLALTPTFLHGVQGWAAGTGRTLTTPTDTTAHSAAAVGQISGTTTTPLAAPPTLIGHINLAAYTNGSYTLTGAGSGGTAIATNDWMYLIHNQFGTIADPVVTTGWTLVKKFTVGSRITTVIYRKKYAGSGLATVTVPTGGSALATLLWVRNASDAVPDFSPVLAADATLITNVVQIPRTEFLNPSLVLTVASAETRLAGTLVASGDVTGATWQYTVGTSPNTRSLVIAAESATVAGISQQTTVTFSAQPEAPTWFGGLQMAIPNSTTLVNRIVAKAKLTALPAVNSPYRISARVKYLTADVWLWDTVKTNGTWLQLRTAKANWGLVKTSTVLSTGEPYGKLLAVIADPATGTFYTTPQQVIGVTTEKSNQWIDLNFFTTTTVDIPATAELWFLHGSTVREHAITWFFDELGVTNRPDWQDHDSAYYIDGDTGIPADPANMMMSDAQLWVDVGRDSYVAWEGTPGNSTSVLFGPSVLYEETECFLDLPYITTCTPALVSDPVRSASAMWMGLLSIDNLKHPSNAEVYQILARSDAVAVGQVRNWETGTISFLTRTIAERYRMVDIIRPGRVMLLRIGEDGYPEDNWYLALGDFDENRLSDDHADPIRTWSASFVHVQRPTGIIEQSSGATWGEVKALGPWSTVKTARDSWLDMLITEPPAPLLVP